MSCTGKLHATRGNAVLRTMRNVIICKWYGGRICRRRTCSLATYIIAPNMTRAIVFAWPGNQGLIPYFTPVCKTRLLRTREVGNTDRYMVVKGWNGTLLTPPFPALTLLSFSRSPACDVSPGFAASCIWHTLVLPSYTASPSPLLASKSIQGVGDPGAFVRLHGRHGELESASTTSLIAIPRLARVTRRWSQSP